MTQEPERLPHGFRERLDELLSNLRQGVLYLRRLVLPSSGLTIGEARLSCKDDGDGNIDPYWRRPDGTESNLSIGGSAGGAPADAQYVTLVADGDLSAERVLTAGEGIDLTDGGANSTITVTVDLSEISASGDLGGTMEAPTVDDGADSTALHDNVAGEIVVVEEKATPVANDEVIIEDSADSNNKKSLKIGNIDHDTLSAGTVAAHDTGATGAELDTLTDGSDADALHDHATLITAAEAITAVEGETTLDLAGDVTIAANKSLAVDTLAEKTGAAGITADGVLIKDYRVETGSGFGKPRIILSFQPLGTGNYTTELRPAFTMTAGRIITLPDAGGEVALDSELHTEAHTVASHSDTTATGTELETLTDGSDADALHAHQALTGTQFKFSITVEDPTPSEDITITFTNAAVTITEMRAVVRGTSPSVTWTIRHHATDRSNAGNEVVTSGTTTTSQTTGSDVTAFNDATIPADSHIWFESTAKSGTVDEFSVTGIGTYD